MNIVLASASPRRQDLLLQVGVSFTVGAIEIDEKPHHNELAIDYVKRMAYEKSVKAQANFGNDCIIITADTIGQIHDDILVKPQNKADAFAMWQKMSGQAHWVHTSVCVCLGQERLQQLVSTSVQFIQLSTDMMQAYWQTGEPADKAGAYAIQGAGAAWVKSIHGSYANVVGLPLVETLAMIEQLKQHS